MPKAHTKAAATAQAGKLSYEDYVRERDSLGKFEQATWEGYEKTILTLSAAFLAFSVSFLGLLQRTEKGAAPRIVERGILFCSWVFFAVAVFIMLCNFMVNAFSLRAAVRDAWHAYESQSRHTAKKWTLVGFAFYFLSGSCFLSGVIALIWFCAANLQIL